MIPLLELALDAHGGLTRWRQVKSIDVKLSIGGQLWHAKGLPQGLNVALQLNNAQAHFRSGKVCNGAGGHVLLLLATPRWVLILLSF